MISEDSAFSQSLRLKAGIHHGSCVAVNLKGKIDYFGSMVNIASRLVDFADEDEIVLSHSVANHPEIVKFLTEVDCSCHWKEASVQLRGFKEEIPITRISFTKSLLRLVI